MKLYKYLKDNFIDITNNKSTENWDRILDKGVVIPYSVDSDFEGLELNDGGKIYVLCRDYNSANRIKIIESTYPEVVPYLPIDGVQQSSYPVGYQDKSNNTLTSIIKFTSFPNGIDLDESVIVPA